MLTAIAVMAAVSAPAPAAVAAAKVPVLGLDFAKHFDDPSILGYGHPHPREIASGGGPGTDWHGIHWKHWGRSRPLGTGHNIGFSPSGTAYAKPVKIQVRVTALGRCAGQRQPAYTRISTREQVRPGGRYGHWEPAINICTGTD